MRKSILLAGVALAAFAAGAQAQDRRPEYGPSVTISAAKKIAAAPSGHWNRSARFVATRPDSGRVASCATSAAIVGTPRSALHRS